MQEPALASVLLESGRHRVGPIVGTYLAALSDAGVLDVPDPEGAFERFYGLIVRDTQIRVLLGEEPPTESQIRARAHEATNDFWVLLVGPAGERRKKLP